MSDGIDIEMIRENYRQMTDSELIRILTVDANGLTDEALIVVKEEIKRRELNPDFLKAAEAQNKTYSDFEIDNYCKLILKLDCPHCGEPGEILNGTMTAEVVSYIFFTEYQKKLIIGCPSCLDMANNKAITKTGLLGWWSPHGFIHTIKALVINSKNKKTNHADEPNDYLRRFVLARIGEIEMHKKEPEELQTIISR